MNTMYFTEEHNLFRQSLKDFLQKEVVPHIEKWEKDGTVERFIWKKFGDMGFFGVNYPEAYGGLETLFQGKLNMVRNAGNSRALFGEDIMSKHQFNLDTVLVENDRKIYKIQISESFEYVNLETPGIFNDGYHPKGWIYIYWDTYAIKKIEYELVAASKAQRSRSKTLYDTDITHKLVLSYKEYQDKMYLNYVYYETPKLVNVGVAIDDPKTEIDESAINKDERYYYTVQEILFTEIITDDAQVKEALAKPWDSDLFSPKPYDKDFWKSYNTLLESKEEEKLIQDLTKRYALFKD